MKSVGSQTQLIKNIKQLEQSEQSQLSQISSLQHKIQQMRSQLKTLSSSASKIIQKKLSIPKGNKPRPVLNPSYESKKLQQIKDQKQKVFRQIGQTKQLIQGLKLQQEPEVKSEIIKRQIQIKEMTLLLKKAVQQKKYIVQELQANKQRISTIKESAYNKDLLQKEKVLQECKKEKSSLQKKSNHIINQQIMSNLYFLQLKSKMQTFDQAKNQKSQSHQVPLQQINILVAQINTIIANRNQIENQKGKEIKDLINRIQQLQRQNLKLNNRFRHVQGQIMKKSLQKRFYKSKMQRISKSTDFINQDVEYSSVYTKKSNQAEQCKPKFSTEAKHYKLKRKPNIIQIGSIQLNNSSKILKDPNILSQNVQRINSIAFLLSDNKIVGIKPTYSGKQGNKFVGQVLSIDRIQRVTEKEVIVKEIKQIQYPLNNRNFCLKLIKYNGSIEIVGTQYYGATVKSNISLKNIKSLELVLQKNKEGSYQKAKGLIINLESKIPVQTTVKGGQTIQDFSQSTEGVFITSSSSILKRKAQSIDNIGNYKKKIVLKPLKKETEGTLDHRLLIRKKLV